ncbi:hypothetical protein OP10G_0123 [Fimbriimonas ginsengisoli Gsoil 348]|uniref:Uncharacterized protein n=1 Tax=Fimbriimonas ginsengisoli Gsoil 348 TaxID=661478 RepID=A0A068NIZ7_FIMGI|nr:hypothetical protein OP10G_0123 [Fimbriimonas ginsengisoli Gsoil 348]
MSLQGGRTAGLQTGPTRFVHVFSSPFCPGVGNPGLISVTSPRSGTNAAFLRRSRVGAGWFLPADSPERTTKFLKVIQRMKVVALAVDGHGSFSRQPP